MSSHDTATDTPLLIVSIIDEVVVVDVPPRLDLETTEALVSTIAAATACGQTVMLDLDDGGRCSPTVWPHPTGGAGRLAEGDDRGRSITVLRAGGIEISTPDVVWTIDLSRRLLCRSPRRVDQRFVDHALWLPVRSLWTTGSRVTVLLSDGRYVSINTTVERSEASSDSSVGVR